jgi:hypothetical protein
MAASCRRWRVSKRFAFASRFDTVVDVLRVGERVTLHTCTWTRRRAA